jgi:glycosyltransferase involved in cell wall biosynthesis
MSIAPKLSVIVPSCDSASTMAQTLAAIRASQLPRADYELIVVDDASSDASATLAARQADTVIRLSGFPSGPAYARNRGADLARGEVLVFVDADIVVQPGTLPRMMAVFAEQPEVDAVSASHGDELPEANFVSQYWNLVLRFGEQRHEGRSACFATGCDAVRRDAFRAVGMYDEWRFHTACLEGVELGQRLKGAGHRIVGSPESTVRRSKRWTLGSVAREVWDRSILLSRSLGYQTTRESSPSEVVFTLSRALMPALGVVGTFMLAAAFLPRPHILEKAALALGVLVLTNLPLHRFCANARGIGFAILTAPVLIVTQSVAAVALCVGWMLRDSVGDRLPDATTRAYSEVGLETWPPVPRPR